MRGSSQIIDTGLYPDCCSLPHGHFLDFRPPHELWGSLSRPSTTTGLTVMPVTHTNHPGARNRARAALSEASYALWESRYLTAGACLRTRRAAKRETARARRRLGRAEVSEQLCER